MEMFVYVIRFSEDAERQLQAVSARDQRIIIDEIEDQLSYEPTKETRNRKQLRPNPLAAWELRVQAYRVLYNVDEAIVTVFVVALARKVRNKFIIEGKEYRL